MDNYLPYIYKFKPFSFFLFNLLIFNLYSSWKNLNLRLNEVCFFYSSIDDLHCWLSFSTIEMFIIFI